MHNLEISRSQATELINGGYTEVTVRPEDQYRSLELVKLRVPGDTKPIYGKVFYIQAPNRISLRHVPTFHAEG